VYSIDKGTVRLLIADVWTLKMENEKLEEVKGQSEYAGGQKALH